MAALRAGDIEKDGTLTPNSMSAAIEAELGALVAVGADEDPIARRKVALAIARGVIDYIVANQAAFTVAVPNGTPTHPQPVVIVKG